MNKKIHPKIKSPTFTGSLSIFDDELKEIDNRNKLGTIMFRITKIKIILKKIKKYHV